MRKLKEFFHVSESKSEHSMPGKEPVPVHMVLQCRLCGSMFTILKGKEEQDFTVLDTHVATHNALYAGKLP